MHYEYNMNKFDDEKLKMHAKLILDSSQLECQRKNSGAERWHCSNAGLAHDTETIESKSQYMRYKILSEHGNWKQRRAQSV